MKLQYNTLDVTTSLLYLVGLTILVFLSCTPTKNRSKRRPYILNSSWVILHFYYHHGWVRQNNDYFT